MIRITELARERVERVLGNGDLAVDATAGKGRDTLFLARAVGPAGRVIAFDIQRQALAETASLLKQNNLAHRVSLVCGGHETMAAHVDTPVAAVMFNLGYLPGGDHGIVTRPETTRRALASSLELLRPGGLITLVLYSGHPQGDQEKKAIVNYCRELDGALYSVVQVRLLNRRGAPPELLVVKKSKNQP